MKQTEKNQNNVVFGQQLHFFKLGVFVQQRGLKTSVGARSWYFTVGHVCV